MHSASALANRGVYNSSFADHTQVADTRQNLSASVATYSYSPSTADTFSLSSNSGHQTQSIVSSLAQSNSLRHNPNHLSSPPSVHQSNTDSPSHHTDMYPTHTGSISYSPSQHTPLVTAAPKGLPHVIIRQLRNFNRVHLKLCSLSSQMLIQHNGKYEPLLLKS